MKTTLQTSSNLRVPGLFAIIAMFIAFSCMDSEVITPDDTRRGDAVLHASGVDDEGQAVAGANLQQTFTARLTGDQENPPAETDGSGQAIFKLSKDGMSLSYKLIVTNLENVTQSHIHCGGPDVNGPVVAFLFGFVAEGVTKNGVLAEGTITAADVIARPDSEACMGGVADFEQLVAKLKSGEAYVNVHTFAYPGGEIRGLIK